MIQLVVFKALEALGKPIDFRIILFYFSSKNVGDFAPCFPFCIVLNYILFRRKPKESYSRLITLNDVHVSIL